MENIYLGIDVGTGSARAGFFTGSGELLSSAARDLEMRKPEKDHVEQSSSQIWDACAAAVRAAAERGKIDVTQVKGIGFDATCSLVVSGAGDSPVSVSGDGNDKWDVVVWMDHRATEIADMINRRGHQVLERTGGRISPEMQVPKLIWLKNHLPGSWSRAKSFYDLPDWLVHKATGTFARSLCSVVCKWTYSGERGLNGEGWNDDFLTDVGLDDLTTERHARIGTEFLRPGEAAGTLTAEAADHLGLSPGIPVASGAIDAYAGAAGTFGIGLGGLDQLEGRLALVGGTSSCHLTLSAEPRFVPGVWGPYNQVLLPDLWANEAGQSASGVLLDHLLRSHPHYAEILHVAQARGVSVYEAIEGQLSLLAGDRYIGLLTKRVHIQPDFHGNRSPLADPERLGAISGLNLASGMDEIALLYLATLQSLAYGTRQIMEALAAQGARIDTIVMSGGLAKSSLYRSQHADITGCHVLTTDHSEAVLLGSAIAGAAAATSDDFKAVMMRMRSDARLAQPDASARPFHDAKYRVFLAMQADFAKYDDIMDGVSR